MERSEIPIPSTGKYAKVKAEQNTDSKKYPQGYFKPKPCKLCSTEFTPNAPSAHYCSDKCKDEAIADAFLHRQYNISLEDYRDLFISQNGKCAVCNSDGRARISIHHNMPLVIDHCHKTHKVRGLLCHTCNTALGQLNDSIDLLKKSIEYLEKPDIVFTKTDRTRIKRERTNEISMSQHIRIISDYHEDGITIPEIMDIHKLSRQRVKSIIGGLTLEAKKAYKKYNEYKESATTIPNGSTLEANANGSSEHPVMDDDIV